MERLLKKAAVAVFVLNLIGCGGGSSSNTTKPESGATTPVNNAPIAQIEADSLEVTAFEAITLSGESSKDPDGDELGYQWKLFDESGKQIQFRMKGQGIVGYYYVDVVTEKQLTFSPDLWGKYAIELVVSDGRKTSSTIAEIDVKPYHRDYPTAKITGVENGKLGSTIWLVGDQSVGAYGQQITYIWQIISTPSNSQVQVQNATKSKAFFIPDVVGRYEFGLTVKHVDDNLTDIETFTVTVDELTTNSTPVAVVKFDDRNFTLGETIKLDASDSYDADGDFIGFQWQWHSKPANSSASLHSNSAMAQFSADVTGRYEVKLIASDASTQSEKIAQINVVNANVAPVANAGQDVSLNINDSTILDGKASTDPEQELLQYEWKLVSKPEGSQYDALDSPSFSARSDHLFQPDVIGEYVFQLTVYDGELYSSIDTITVTVFEDARPVAVLPEDFVVYNDEKITIDGSKSYDKENQTLTYKWSFKNKPSNFFGLLISNNETANFSPTEDGTYTIQLIVNDGEQDSIEDTIVVVKETPVFTRTVTGRFVDQGGNPIEGVEVEGLRGTKVRANANGEFTITLQSERENDGVFNTIDLTYGFGTEVNFNLMTFADGDVDIGDFVLPVHQWKDITVTSCAGYAGDNDISLTFATITPDTPELLFRTNIVKLFTVDGATSRVLLPASTGTWAVFYHTAFKYNVSSDDHKVYFIHDYQTDDSQVDLVNLNVCDNK